MATCKYCDLSLAKHSDVQLELCNENQRRLDVIEALRLRYAADQKERRKQLTIKLTKKEN